MVTSTVAPPPITIRPVGPADHVGLGQFYASLSVDSRYARFLASGHGVADRVVDTFCGPDHEHREGLVASARDDAGQERIVGHLCLDPVGDGTFEMAVAVADVWRGQGIGHRLLDEAIAWARRHDIVRLRATMLATNTPVIALIRATGCAVAQTGPDGGVIEASIDIGSPIRAAASTGSRAQAPDVEPAS